MCQFNVFWGVICVFFVYWIVKEFKFCCNVVWFVIFMVFCENLYIIIFWFIFFDFMFLFGIVVMIFCWVKFYGQCKNSFEFEWFFWLFMIGFSIGFVISVKLVGFFVIVLVGFYIIEDFWNKFGDIKMLIFIFVVYVGICVVGFIILFFFVYFFSFVIYFVVFINSGFGDVQMFLFFQVNLRGIEVGRNSLLEVVIGFKVIIKNMGYGGGFFYSYVQIYFEGFGQ